MPSKIKPAETPWVQKTPKTGSNQKYYNSAEHRNMAKAYKEKNPICEVCEARGKIKAIIDGNRRIGVFDHIIPIDKEGSKSDPANRMSMCSYQKGSCHDKKRNLEKRGIIVDWVLNGKGERVPKRRQDIIELLNNEK